MFTMRLDDVDVPLETFEERPHGFFAKPEFGRQDEWASQLARAVRDAITTVQHAEASEDEDLGFLVGQTREMHEVAAAIRTAAGNRLAVLIYGETGTGRRRAAEAIHRLSDRTGRFEHYDCSGADFGLAQETLFGGGLTGAFESGGLFKLADQGTLLLDEIQGLPVALQDRVVEAVERGRPGRAGAVSEEAVDVRLIVSTNHSLSDLVADGVLRRDLAYRLAEGLPVSLPPLRQRMVDLPVLFARLVERANEETQRGVSTVLRPETRKKLEAYAWPGNVRELKSTLVRAVATTNSNVLLPEDIAFVAIARPESDCSEHEDHPAVPLPPAHAGALDTIEPAVAAVTNHLESLPIPKRYEYLRSQGG